jgi:hypothetical protein
MNGKKQETDANKDSRMLKLLHNQETNGLKILSQQKAKNHRNIFPPPFSRPPSPEFRAREIEGPTQTP